MVSIIVPIYNTGKYLQRCVESICAQSYTNLQIILVDDGSESYTANLCDSLAEKDSRIKVIHKKNEGVSIARNVGLSLADGDVICFVDSDDSIVPQMIERLVEALETNDAQIAMCDAVTITPGKPDAPDTIADLPNTCLLHKKDITPAMLTQLAGSACRCAYRRTDMPLAMQAGFPEGIKFSEDRIFNIAAMGSIARIAYIKEPLYLRLIREGSACFRFYPDMTAQIVKMRDVLLPIVKQFWGDNYIAAYESQIAGQIKYAVTNFTSPRCDLSMYGRIEKLKELCASNKIKECLLASGCQDMRSRLITHNHYLMLAFIGTATNLYHKICHKGQFQQ